jgi:hypothetical protein
MGMRAATAAAAAVMYMPAATVRHVPLIAARAICLQQAMNVKPMQCAEYG